MILSKPTITDDNLSDTKDESLLGMFSRKHKHNKKENWQNQVILMGDDPAICNTYQSHLKIPWKMTWFFISMYIRNNLLPANIVEPNTRTTTFLFEYPSPFLPPSVLNNSSHLTQPGVCRGDWQVPSAVFMLPKENLSSFHKWKHLYFPKENIKKRTHFLIFYHGIKNQQKL